MQGQSPFPSFNYITYGAKTTAREVGLLLEHALDTMLQTPGERPTPVCIWGLHGIGKTELVRDLAQARGCQFVYIAPAQFEEMGDLHGMDEQAMAALEGTTFSAWLDLYELPQSVRSWFGVQANKCTKK